MLAVAGGGPSLLYSPPRSGIQKTERRRRRGAAQTERLIQEASKLYMKVIDFHMLFECLSDKPLRLHDSVVVVVRVFFRSLTWLASIREYKGE